MTGAAACANNKAPSVSDDVISANVKSFDGVTIAAECWNCDETKTLVFVHGWSLSKAVWRRQIAAFSDHYRIIAYDLRGHGGSTRPADRDAFMGRWTHARDTEAVLDHFNVDSCAVVIGWSFGAIVAADAAVHLGPDRICGVTLVAGSPDAATEETRSYFGPLLGAIGAMRDGPRGAAEEQAVTRFLQDSYLYEDWDEKLYAELFSIVMSLSPDERRRVVARPTYSNIDGLNEAGTPMLLIHGAADPAIVADASTKTAAKLNTATIKIYPDTGHWPFLEREDDFNTDLESFTITALRRETPQKPNKP